MTRVGFLLTIMSSIMRDSHQQHSWGYQLWFTLMGTCPFCLVSTLEGDTICFSCGRVISGASGMVSRERGEFQRGSTTGARRGLAPRQKSKPRMRRRGKKSSRLYQIMTISIIAFAMTSADAKEFLMGQWAEFQDAIGDAIGPEFSYPREAEYTLVRSVSLWNNGSVNAELVEAVAIPQDVYDYELGAGLSVNGELREKVLIQEIKSVTVLIDGESINVPLNGATISYENAQTTAQGSKIWWPQTDPDATSSDENKVCLHGPCVRFNTIIPPGQQTSTCKFTDAMTGVAKDTMCHKRVDFVVTMKSKSYTWWNSATISSLVEGKQWGVNAEKSGTFADIPNRESGIRSNTFLQSQKWYDRGGNDYAIDGTGAAPHVIQASSNVMANLPADKKENVYAYARAAFDYMADSSSPGFVRYPSAQELVTMGGTPRSGQQCLADGIGDCDEQSNAYMSIMRVKNVPTWYAFGALTGTFERWEGHGWAYIMIPMSEEYCNSVNIPINSCYIEGPVDVVNRKWLTHTPTEYIDWIEEAGSGNKGERVNGYYTVGQGCGTANNEPKLCTEQSPGSELNRQRNFFTEGSPVISGTWTSKYSSEDLGASST